MIAGAVFVLAGVIALQNVSVVNDEMRHAEFALYAMVCWLLALLCMIGIIH